MIHPEKTSGWEPASSSELNNLYYKTSKLVKKVGIYTIEHHGEPRQHQGLFISNQPPRYELSLSVDEVLDISPRAAGTLNVGKSLDLMYFEQYYTPLWAGGFRYEAPSCAFQVNYPDSSPYSYKYMQIDLSGTGEADSGVHSELRGPSENLSHIPKTEALIGFVGRLELENLTGADKITGAECQALIEIVEAKTRTS
jgi:hypothetical protein